MLARERFASSTLVLIVVVALAGCSGAPDETLELSRQSVANAEAAGAEDFAPVELAEAREALAAAQAELEVQNEKFALSRSYSHAEELLATADARAQEAVQAAEEAKAVARQEAESTVQAASTAVSDLQTLIAEVEACPRKPKGFAGDMTVLKGEVEGLSASLEPLSSALVSQDFTTARTQAEALNSRAALLRTDLENARQKMGCAPPVTAGSTAESETGSAEQTL